MLQALLLLLSLPCLSPALGQTGFGGSLERTHRFDGAPWDEFGAAVASAGDLDGDGLPDIEVGARAADPGGRTDAGAAYVYSGATGALILEFGGRYPFERVGWSVAGAGDVDRDGTPDLITGTVDASPTGPASGSAYVVSGRTSAVLYRFDGESRSDRFGWSVDGAGDVNGDGHADVIVGAPTANPGNISSGMAYVYSGSDGSELYRFQGEALHDGLGHAVAGPGDVTGDGVPDLAISAPGAAPGGVTDAGAVYIVSGADGGLVHVFAGPMAGESLGRSMALAGDVNGDGCQDLIASTSDPPDTGAAYVFSGRDGQLLYRFDTEMQYDSFGRAVAGAGDADGDGFDDLVVGASGATPGLYGQAGAAYLYSGRDGRHMATLAGEGISDHLGTSVAGLGDIDGDGRPDFAAGAPWAEPIFDPAGSVYVSHFEPFLTASLSTLSASGGPPVELQLDFPATEAGRRYAVLASASGTGPSCLFGLLVPLATDPLYTRMLSGWSPALLQGGQGTLDAQGDAAARVLSDPRLSAALGRTLFLAAVAYDPNGPAPSKSSIARFLTVVP